VSHGPAGIVFVSAQMKKTGLPQKKLHRYPRQSCGGIQGRDVADKEEIDGERPGRREHSQGRDIGQDKRRKQDPFQKKKERECEGRGTERGKSFRETTQTTVRHRKNILKNCPEAGGGRGGKKVHWGGAFAPTETRVQKAGHRPCKGVRLRRGGKRRRKGAGGTMRAIRNKRIGAGSVGRTTHPARG